MNEQTTRAQEAYNSSQEFEPRIERTSTNQSQAEGDFCPIATALRGELVLIGSNHRGRTLHHFVQRLIARIDKVLRHTGLVEHARVLRVDSGALVERGEDFLKLDGAQLRVLAVSVG